MMPNGGRKWVKPGELSRQVQASNYLLKRKKIIKQNAEKLASLGLPPTARTIFGSAQGTNKKGKRNVSGNDKDENYIPPEDDDVNDESSWSQSDEIAEMPRENRVKRARRIAATLGLTRVECPPEASTQPPSAALRVTRSGGSGSTPDLAVPPPLPIQPPTTQPLLTQPQPSHLRVTRSGVSGSTPDLAVPPPLSIQPPTTQPLPTQPQPSQPPTSPHTVGSSVASAPASEVPSRVRGVTRGKTVTKLRTQLGHNIPVPIPISSHRPEGEHAPSLVNHLGLAIREVAPVRPHGWKKLDIGIKLAVIATVQTVFDIGDYEGDMQLRADVDRQCGVLYKSWKYELHCHYLELLEQGVPRPQDHPAEGCSLADWQLMVSQCWESPAWKVKSKKAQESRAKLPYNHTGGSRSFASRLSMMTKQNAGQAPPITQFFRDTHYREKSNQWINEVAQQRHEALVQRTEEQSQPSVTAPMTQEQIVVDVLGQRSGYLKGYGIYTRTSASSTRSRTPDPEVIALREQLAEQGRRVAEQDRKVAEQDKRQRTLEALVQQLAAASGIDLTSFQDIMRGTSSAGDGTSTGDHDATL